MCEKGSRQEEIKIKKWRAVSIYVNVLWEWKKKSMTLAKGQKPKQTKIRGRKRKGET